MEIEFISRRNLVGDIWEYEFSKPNSLVFDAGDYVEVGIPDIGTHWLSMASSPEEKHLLFTIKLRDEISGFKAFLQKMQIGDKAYISPAIGNFNLPRNNAKILFIALGIGITPYRSMLLDANADKYDIALLYAAKPNEHIYEDAINKSLVKYIKHEARFHISELPKLVPDYTERIIYLSGPQTACIQIYTELVESGYDRHKIKLEYFPGYLNI